MPLYQYTRTRPNFISGFRQQQRTGYNPSQSNATIIYGSVQEVTKGSKVESYRRKILAGLDASSDYFRSSVQFPAQPPYVCVLKNGYSGALASQETITTNVGGMFPTFPSGQIIDLAVSRNWAASNFYSKLDEKLAPFKSLVFLAEMKEAKQMVLKRTIQFAAHILQLKRLVKYKVRHIRHKEHRLKTASNLWLEYSFGWAPFISDIDSAFEAFAPRNIEIRVKGQRLDIVGFNPGNEVTGFSTYLGYIYCYASGKSKVRSKFTYGFHLPISRLQSTGITPGELLPALWEATPYSFLVDYFVGIGEWLGAQQWSNLEFAYGTFSVKQEDTITMRFVPSTTSKIVSQNSNTTSITRTQYQRDRMTTLPRFYPPLKICDGISPKKLLNIVALITGRVL